MNTGRFYYDLMKVNILGSTYVDNGYKAGWENNIYPIFHDAKYSFHIEVAKFFSLADEKKVNNVCIFLDSYTDTRADFTNFESGLEKIMGQGNLLPILHYCFASKHYLDLLENIKLNKSRFSTHFVNRMHVHGYL